MPFWFDVLYKAPADPERDERILQCVSKYGGELEERSEVPYRVTLTIRLADDRQWEEIAEALRNRDDAIHIEPGPYYDEDD